jgi:glycosyltransferase involved in cell wall biosynthesis
MWTPLRPTRSGIADYVEEFLPFLADDQMQGAASVPPATIDLYTLDELESDDVPDRCAVLHPASFEVIHRHRPYDVIIYQIGSTPEHHHYICEQSIKHPGLLVMHDPNIHSYALARLGAGNLPAYLKAVRDELGDDMVAYVRQAIDDGTFSEKVVYEYNMDGWLLRHSRGAIYHSYFAMQDTRQRWPEVPSFYVPLYAVKPARSNDEQRQLILSRRGWPAESVIIGAFGIMAPSKRVGVLLRAFKQLAWRYPQVVLTLVGNTAYYDVAKEVDQLGLDRERVCVTDEVPMDDFLAYMQAVDIGVNLRYPSLGESSAIISRLIGMGKPIITSDIPQFGELPDEFCWKVPVGEHEVDVLMAYLNELTWDRDLRQEMGRAALTYARESMSPFLAAQGYLRIAEHIFCGGPEPHLEEHIPAQYRRRAEETVRAGQVRRRRNVQGRQIQ